MTSQVERAAGSRSNTQAMSSRIRVNIDIPGGRYAALSETLVNWSTISRGTPVVPGSEHAAQNVDLHRLPPRLCEQPAQAIHELARVPRVQIAACVQAALEMRKEFLHLLVSRAPDPRRRGGRTERGHAQLVGDHLHRLSEIEGRVIRIGRNARKGAAPHDLLVREADGFVAEDDGDLVLSRRAQELLRRSARIERRM